MQETLDTKSARITVFKTNDYQVDIEYSKFFCIVHLPKVKKFTKDMYLELKTRFDELKEFAKTIGYMAIYAAVYSNDKPTEKFAKSMGMTYKGSSDGFQIYEVQVGED